MPDSLQKITYSNDNGCLTIFLTTAPITTKGKKIQIEHEAYSLWEGSLPATVAHNFVG